MVPVCGKLLCCVCWDGVGVQGICGVSTARRRLYNMGGHRAHRAWNDRREAHQRRYRSSDFVPQNRQLETDDLASKTKSRFLPHRFYDVYHGRPWACLVLERLQTSCWPQGRSIYLRVPRQNLVQFAPALKLFTHREPLKKPVVCRSDVSLLAPLSTGAEIYILS